jgi:hypothetical protein
MAGTSLHSMKVICSGLNAKRHLAAEAGGPQALPDRPVLPELRERQELRERRAALGYSLTVTP